MKALVITTDSLPGRTLMALRAGAMTTEQLNERFATNVAPQLVARGLAEFTGEYYLITEAGRAACPLRNPLAAPGLPKPAPAKITIKESEMSKAKPITRQEVLEAIQAAGVAGITRKALLEKFGGDTCVDVHVYMLNSAKAIYKPEKGLLVAATFPRPDGAATEMVVMKPTAAQDPAPKKPAKPSRSEIGRMGRSKSSWDRAPAVDPKKTSPFQDEAQTEQRPPAPASALADQPQVSEITAAASQAEILRPQQPAESEVAPVPAPAPAAPAQEGSLLDRLRVAMANTDIVELGTIDGLEIAIYNTGRLVMESGDGIVEMSKEVVHELRRFLSRYAEEAASV